MIRQWTTVGLALAALAAPGQGAAQADRCVLPRTIAPAPERPAPAAEVSRTPYDHHVLAMTWSPEWCRERADRPSERLQCRDNSFGFVLHGLWPSAAKGPHPRYCRRAPPLAPETVRQSLCMTPSAELLQHEWAAHGTCAWPDSRRYFETARQLWATFRRPEPRPGVMTAGELRAAFRKANPSLPAEAIHVRVSSGNRLLEVGLCLDLAFHPRACPRGTGAPDHVRLRVTPRAR